MIICGPKKRGLASGLLAKVARNAMFAPRLLSTSDDWLGRVDDYVPALSAVEAVINLFGWLSRLLSPQMSLMCIGMIATARYSLVATCFGWVVSCLDACHMWQFVGLQFWSPARTMLVKKQCATKRLIMRVLFGCNHLNSCKPNQSVRAAESSECNGKTVLVISSKVFVMSHARLCVSWMVWCA